MKVTELWRFPVKSLGGEQLESCTVGEVGLEFDRGWGIVDNATGNVLTARREPRLLFASSRSERGNFVIVLPDGKETDSSTDVAAWLDRDVTVLRAGSEGGTYEVPLDFENDADWASWQGPPLAWHDSSQARVSMLSTATVGDWDRRRFRANVLLEGAGEDETLGHTVKLGDVLLDVQEQLGRCVMVTRPQPGIERDLEVLKRINRERGSLLAVGALVRRRGTVAVGDTLSDLGEFG
ncbi:MAG: MOSC domain-containing protein [Acidimicrobiales bacterium]